MKASSDVYAPLSGEVTEVNASLLANPQFINEDAAGKGWIAKMKPSSIGEMDSLLSEGDYAAWVEEEKSKGH
jgi:glycine cleavage system H protein